MVPVVALFVIGFIVIDSAITHRSIAKVITGDHTPDPTDTSYKLDGSTLVTNTDPTGVPSLVNKSGSGGGKGRPNNGLSHFDGHLVSAWIVPVLKWARANGWKGTVTSGYRTFAQQESVHSTFGPKAPPGTSNHEKVNYPGGAVDVSDYTTLAQLVSNYPGPGPTLVSGAGINDPLHFSANGH